jgi:hypothetical protein
LHLGVSCGDPFLAAQFSRNLAGAMRRRFAARVGRAGDGGRRLTRPII